MPAKWHTLTPTKKLSTIPSLYIMYKIGTKTYLGTHNANSCSVSMSDIRIGPALITSSPSGVQDTQINSGTDGG